MEKKEALKIKLNLAVVIIETIFLTTMIIVFCIYHIAKPKKQTNRGIAENIVVEEIKKEDDSEKEKKTKDLSSNKEISLL